MDGWNKETLLAEMRGGLSVRAICKKHAELLGRSWKGLYAEVYKWRKQDDGFELVYSQFISSHALESRGLTKPAKDVKKWGNWRVECAREYARTQDLMVAAKATPYSKRTLYNMLTPSHASFDEQLYLMIESVERSICEMMKTGVIEDWNAEEPGGKRARIAFRYLQSMDSRFKTKTQVDGTVQQVHSVEAVTMEALAAEQRKAFGHKPKALEATTVVDVEYEPVQA